MIGTVRILSVSLAVVIAFASGVTHAADATKPTEMVELKRLIVVTNNATISDGRYRRTVPICSILSAEDAKDGVHWVPGLKGWIKEQYVEPLTASAIAKCSNNGASEAAWARAVAILAAQESKESEASSRSAAVEAEKAMKAAETGSKSAKEAMGKAAAAAVEAEKATKAAESSSESAKESMGKAVAAAGAAAVSAGNAKQSADIASLAAATAVNAMKESEAIAKRVEEIADRFGATNLSFDPTTLDARIRVRTVDGVAKCELLEFGPKPSKLSIINLKSQPKTLASPMRAMFTVRVFEKVDGDKPRCVGESRRAYRVVFEKDEPDAATAKDAACPFSCGASLDRSSADVAFGNPFEDLSGEIELILKCDGRVKKKEVRQVELHGYVQFILPKEGGGDSGVLGSIQEIENSITLSLQYVP